MQTAFHLVDPICAVPHLPISFIHFVPNFKRAPTPSACFAEPKTHKLCKICHTLHIYIFLTYHTNKCMRGSSSSYRGLTYHNNTKLQTHRVWGDLGVALCCVFAVRCHSLYSVPKSHSCCIYIYIVVV